MRYLDNKRTRWPVDPAKYPLQGRMTGEPYLPEPYVPTLPGWARATILFAGAFTLWACAVVGLAFFVQWVGTLK